MSKQLRFKLRNETTLDYMVDHGEFTPLDSPSENIFCTIKHGQHYLIVHEATGLYVHATGQFLSEVDKETGLFQIVNGEINQRNVRYAINVSSTADSNNVSDNKNDPIRWLLEETDDEQITFVTCGSSETMTDEEVVESMRSSMGGEPLIRELRALREEDKDGATMQKHLSENGEKAWITIDEGRGAMAVSGNSMIIVDIFTPDSEKGFQVLSRHHGSLKSLKAKGFRENGEDEEGVIGLVEVSYVNGDKTTIQTLGMLGSEALVGGLIYQIGRQIITAGLTAVGNWVAETKLVAALDRAMSRSILTSMRSGRYFAAMRTLGARTLFTTLRIVGPVLNFAAVSIALAAIALIVIPFFFKNQKSVIKITNYTKKDFMVNIPYTGNVPIKGQDNDKDAPYSIPKFIEKGDKTTITVGGKEREVTAEQNVICYRKFTFTNDRNFSEGFGVMLQLTEYINDEPRDYSLYISNDIPWIAKNTINLRFQDYAVSNPKNIATNMLKTHKKLHHECKDSQFDFKAEMGISALSGGEDHSYLVQVNILPLT
ncbi:hypothetical protein ACH42_01790 [Endozoicomonas sp. (ex Bugula neritina AB1)]|nr:hypothetical protein ACH42_01790 [Endozoicomonas sp. (ex Bugula neritina AB1)]